MGIAIEHKAICQLIYKVMRTTYSNSKGLIVILVNSLNTYIKRKDDNVIDDRAQDTQTAN